MFRRISKNKGILVLAAIVLASLLWMTSQARKPGRTGPLERAAGFVSYPFVKAVDKSVRTVRGVWEGYLYFIGMGRENGRLKVENARLSLENVRLREALAKQKRDSALWSLVGQAPYGAIQASAVGRDASSWFRSLWVDKGEGDGVVKNMPAAAARGVVGRVIKTYGGTARVLLITDPSSAVSCLTERTREPGILVGDGAGGCRLMYVGKHSDIRQGDLIVTSGLDNVFPKGLPAATVTAVSRSAPGYFLTVDALPAADVARIEELLILKYEPTPTDIREPERGLERKR